MPPQPQIATPGAPGRISLATQVNIDNLARVIMSEAGIYNTAEQTAVGYTLVNRMSRNHTGAVAAAWRGYTHNQTPTASVRVLATNILSGAIFDPTQGATHFYSPQVMPAENDNTQGYDVRGGLEQVPGLPGRTYRPGFTNPPFQLVTVPGVIPSEFKFYREPGNGPVR